jgi:uncharacterized protein DUF5979
MIQVIPHVVTNIGFGGNTVFCAIVGSGNGVAQFDANPGRIPLPWPVTVRNLVLYSRDTTRTQNITVTIRKDLADTLLTGVLPSASIGPLVFSGIDISFVQFDDFSYKFSAPSANMTLAMGLSVDIESIGNVFGISPAGASPFFAINSGYFGGAFGNGTPQGYSGAITGTVGHSNSASICASPGNVTTLVLKNYAGVTPVGATWIGVIIKNNVIQDGSGGTVDTRCTITAGNDRAASTFVLPVVKGDNVDALWYLASATSFPVVGQIGVGIGFVPTNADYFMLCGGSNNVWGFPTVGYGWVLSEQGLTTEPLALAPISPSGLIARGIYVENNTPLNGLSYTHTLRQNEGPTPITIITFTDHALIENQFVQYNGNDTIDLQVSGEPSAGTSPIFWGLEATVILPEPPPPTGNLVVVKELSNIIDGVTEFTIAVGGGLIPASINLKQNESQSYNNIVAGSGYSVSETPPVGWNLDSIIVSNGSPPNNITVGEGETVTVTVTNSFINVESLPSGIYKIVPGKRQDTLWTSVDSSETRDVKKPNPFVRTALIGE